MKKIGTQALLFLMLTALIGNNLWIAPIKAQTESRSANTNIQLVESRKLTDDCTCSFWRVSEKNKLYTFFQQQEHQIVFKDESGNTLIAYPYLPDSKICCSPAQHYILTVTFESPITCFPELRVIHFHVYNHLGQEKYHIEQLLGHDDPIPKCYLLDSGEAILADATLGKLVLFSSKGQQKKLIRLFSKNIFCDEKSMSVAISKYNEFMVVAAQPKLATSGQMTDQSRSGDSFLFYLTTDGIELWRKTIKGQIAGKVAISPDGAFCAVGYYSSQVQHSENRVTEIYDFSGKRILILNAAFEKASFSVDDRHLALANHDKMQVIDLQKKQTLWHCSALTQQNRSIIDLHIRPSSKTIAIMTGNKKLVGNKIIFIQPKLELYDIQGSCIWQRQFENKQIVAPSFAFGGTGMKFGIGFRHSYQIYEAIGESVSKL